MPVISFAHSQLPVLGLSLLFERSLRGPGCWYFYLLFQVKAIAKLFVYKLLLIIHQKRHVKIAAAYLDIVLLCLVLVHSNVTSQG